jgi:hypothetical protein
VRPSGPRAARQLVKAVNLEKLAKQLRRDTAANPKKAAALGLMILVALYFWGPLAWKWFSASGSKRSAKTSLASLILTDDPVEPSQQTKARGGAKFKWEKARQLIKQDPRMISANFDLGWIDPFGKPAGETKAEHATEKSPEETVGRPAANAALDAGELGLKLEGVLIGSRSRVATINGEPCHEGDMISVSTKKEDKEETIQLRVVRIRRQAVELDMNGRTLLLELAQPKLQRGDEIGKQKGSN